jgi:hypothetical protein
MGPLPTGFDGAFGRIQVWVIGGSGPPARMEVRREGRRALARTMKPPTGTGARDEQYQTPAEPRRARSGSFEPLPYGVIRASTLVEGLVRALWFTHGPEGLTGRPHMEVRGLISMPPRCPGALCLTCDAAPPPT